MLENRSYDISTARVLLIKPEGIEQLDPLSEQNQEMPVPSWTGMTDPARSGTARRQTFCSCPAIVNWN